MITHQHIPATITAEEASSCFSNTWYMYLTLHISNLVFLFQKHLIHLHVPNFYPASISDISYLQWYIPASINQILIPASSYSCFNNTWCIYIFLLHHIPASIYRWCIYIFLLAIKFYTCICVFLLQCLYMSNILASYESSVIHLYIPAAILKLNLWYILHLCMSIDCCCMSLK